MTYKTDRRWSDKYIPTIKKIVGEYMLDVAPDVIDCKQASDLIVMRGRDTMIACRIRRAEYLKKYPYDFTIRCRRDSGAETEFSKIVNGFADWMFYGFALNDELPIIARWFLINLDHWRAHMIRRKGRIWTEIPNGDGTFFAAFDIRTFTDPPALLIAASDETLLVQRSYEKAGMPL